MGVNIVVDKDIAYFDVYTRKRYFKVYGTVHSSAADEKTCDYDGITCYGGKAEHGGRNSTH